MCAGTAATTFRGKHQALRRNNPQPAATTNALELGFLVGLNIPDTMEVRAIKHTVVARSHVAATAALREISADFGAFAQIVSDAVGIIRFANHQRMLKVATVVILGGFAAFIPQLWHLSFALAETLGGRTDVVGVGVIHLIAITAGGHKGA